MERNNCFSEVDPIPVFLAIYGMIRFVASVKGISIEQGIVLVADNEQKAAQFLSRFCGAFDNAIEYKNWNAKSQSPDNYFVGLMLSRGRKTQHIEDFLMEKEFLSVVITGGILPDSLRTDSYVLRITEATMNTLENPLILQTIQNVGDKCTRNIEYLLERIDSVGQECSNIHIQEERKNLYFGLILCGNLFFHELNNVITTDLSSDLWCTYGSRVEELLCSIDDYAGGIDVVAAIVEAVCDYIASGKSIAVIDRECVTEDDIECIDRQECILYDEIYYYIPQCLFAKMCRDLLGIWSICELKKQACNLNILESDNSADYTCKITVNTGTTKRRIRFLKILKDCFFNEYSEGLEIYQLEGEHR